MFGAARVFARAGRGVMTGSRLLSKWLFKFRGRGVARCPATISLFS